MSRYNSHDFLELLTRLLDYASLTEDYPNGYLAVYKVGQPGTNKSTLATDQLAFKILMELMRNGSRPIVMFGDLHLDFWRKCEFEGIIAKGSTSCDAVINCGAEVQRAREKGLLPLGPPHDGPHF